MMWIFSSSESDEEFPQAVSPGQGVEEVESH